MYRLYWVLNIKNHINNRTITTNKYHTLRCKVLFIDLFIGTWSIEWIWSHQRNYYLLVNRMNEFHCYNNINIKSDVIEKKLKDEIIDPTIRDKFSFGIWCKQKYWIQRKETTNVSQMSTTSTNNFLLSRFICFSGQSVVGVYWMFESSFLMLSHKVDSFVYPSVCLFVVQWKDCH
jgi:hypothetical protein